MRVTVFVSHAATGVTQLAMGVIQAGNEVARAALVVMQTSMIVMAIPGAAAKKRTVVFHAAEGGVEPNGIGFQPGGFA